MGKWRTYEKLVYNYYCSICQENCNDWEVSYNRMIEGKKSNIKRQVDILIESKLQNMNKIIDCKCYKRPIHIKNVEEIIGMIEDVNANAGVIVSPMGFPASVRNMAKNYGRLELVELNFKDLFPYRFYNNNRIDSICPNCKGKSPFGGKLKNSIINITEYDIVYREDRERYTKVNIGFCNECSSQVFYCNECNRTVVLNLDDIKNGVIRECKCGIRYNMYVGIDAYGNNQIYFKYTDSNGNELFSENNMQYMYNNYGVMLDNH